ncbi:MAG: sulfatase-like hydrolase/transferase [Bacteroidota bacterium]
MNLKKHLIGMLILGLVYTACKVSTKKTAEIRPNIILIMSDDHGWYDVGFNGNTEIKTPNMDALAAKGVILDRFYSASAVCSPTRASLITGRNPLRIDIPYANQGHLKKEEITIPEILREHGYVTGHYGKWHLGTLTQSELDANRGGRKKYRDEYTIPTEHGYDEFFCTESKVPTYDPMIYPAIFIKGESKRYGWRAIENNDTVKNYGTAYWNGENSKVSTNLNGDNSRVIMDRVIPFIQKAHNKNSPFFATIWFHTPHLPVVSDSIHRDLYNGMDLQKQIYYGTLTAMDEQIGRLWKEIEKLNISENTIVFYCSDNGPEVNTPGSAGIFRKRKRSLYEGGVRVPAFAVWPNKFKEGTRIDFPIVTSDYLPTVLEILNIKYPDSRPLDGMSILDAIDGKIMERDKPIGFICDPNMSWVTNQYKLICNIKDERFEMYDLINDKSEKENIIDKYPEIAEEMKSNLEKWLKSVENSKNGIDYFN